MILSVITEPTIEPVSLVEAKLHLRVDHDEEDDLISGLIKAARINLEDRCRRAFLTQTVEYRLDAFPDSRFELPRPPLQSVTSIKYVDTDEVEHTVSTDVYGVETLAEPGIVFLKYGQSWPSEDLIAVGGFRVRYVCGWTAADDVPQTIKNAMLLVVGFLYENREDTIVSAGLTKIELRAVENLIRNERIYGF